MTKCGSLRLPCVSGVADLPWPRKALGPALEGRVGALPKGAALRLLPGVLRHEPRGLVRQPLQLELVSVRTITRSPSIRRTIVQKTTRTAGAFDLGKLFGPRQCLNFGSLTSVQIHGARSAPLFGDPLRKKGGRNSASLQDLCGLIHHGVPVKAAANENVDPQTFQ